MTMLRERSWHLDYRFVDRPDHILYIIPGFKDSYFL